jgi:8-oxo-dGTP pyrophosphatase MutT (NUDIX family)
MKQDRAIKPQAEVPAPLDACPVQYGALPVRKGKQGPEVLLVTSRETGRWIIPKGWPMAGKKPHQAAAQEALEEAGVRGAVQKKPLGEFPAFKRFEEHFVLCSIRVFLLDVKEERKTWKEQHQRKRAWFTPAQAAALVDEPGLAALIEQLPEQK